MPHPIELIEQVCGLRGRYTAPQVAQKLGLPSKNAVIGIWNRNPDLLPIQFRRTVKQAKFKRRETPVVPTRVIASPPSAVLQEANSAALDAVMKIKTYECRYPFGHPREPEFRFCSEPSDGGPYCAEHRALCRSDVPPPRWARVRVPA